MWERNIDRLQPRRVPWPGLKPVTFLWMIPTNLAMLVRAGGLFFLADYKCHEGKSIHCLSCSPLCFQYFCLHGIYQAFDKYFLKDCIYFIFREGKGGRKRGRETSHGCPSHAPNWGSGLSNSGMCPDWELNQRPFGSQADAQSTEPHQPGLRKKVTKNFVLFLCLI